MQAEFRQLHEQNHQQQQEINQLKISEESFKNDDSKVKYYTGLPTHAVLLTLFQFLEASMPEKNLFDRISAVCTTSY